jgi:hypothetical protein
MEDMRSRTIPLKLVAALAMVAASLIFGTPAWASTVGQPPAPGYPPCTKVGDDGNDVIRGTKRRDVICADEGNDVVYGKGGNDWLFGGNGRDVFYGGPGDDRFNTWRGRDRIFGEAGDDIMNGEIGNDILVGGPGRDLFMGAEGNDCFYAIDGEKDELKGMTGVDNHESDPDLDQINGSTEGPADCYGPA